MEMSTQEVRIFPRVRAGRQELHAEQPNEIHRDRIYLVHTSKIRSGPTLGSPGDDSQSG